jgi:hypothetical protein
MAVVDAVVTFPLRRRTGLVGRAKTQPTFQPPTHSPASDLIVFVVVMDRSDFRRRRQVRPRPPKGIGQLSWLTRPLPNVRPLHGCVSSQLPVP